MAYRGLSFNGSAIPVSSISTQISRNLIADQSMGTVGEAKQFGGAMIVTGSIEAPYRETALTSIVENVLGGTKANGIVELPASPAKSMILGDEYGNTVTFSSTIINSMDFSLNVKEFAKVTFNYIAQRGVSGGTVPQATYTEDIPVFYNAMLTTTAGAISCSGVNFKIDRPIDQDYYVLGSEFLQEYVQNGNASVSGSLTFAAKDWTTFLKAFNYASDTVAASESNANPVSIGNLEIVLRNPAGTSDIETITVDAIAVNDASLSVQGRNRFEKTLNWKANINSDENIKFT